MELGMIGLGRMGANMVLRLLRDKHRVVVFDFNEKAVQSVVEKGAIAAKSQADLAAKLMSPRVIWIMVPAGEATEKTVDSLASHLSGGDTVIDGGNSYYRDSMRRAKSLAQRGIAFLDAGTSGGIWGLGEGYCLMVGGSRQAFRYAEPIFRTLAPAPDKGYGWVGPSGAGHFVKMVHNGIEYGMMEAYAEGFELMRAKREFEVQLGEVAEIWRYGSVIRSWLLDLAAAALKSAPDLDEIDAYVVDSGEGRWTVQEAVELAVPVPVIADALQVRFRSRQERPFGPRLLAALRGEFGGHEVRKVREKQA